jgi:hypothetical protein
MLAPALNNVCCAIVVESESSHAAAAILRQMHADRAGLCMIVSIMHGALAISCARDCEAPLQFGGGKTQKKDLLAAAGRRLIG